MILLKSKNSLPLHNWIWLLFLFVLGGKSALAFDYKLMLDTPSQSYGSTCQSYVLAVALSMLESAVQPYTYRWRIDNSDELQILEFAIRGGVVREMKIRFKRNLTADDGSYIGDWDKAIRKLTFDRYRVREKTFISIDDMMDFLKSKVSIRLKGNPLSIFTIPTPTTVYFTSFSRIDNRPYRNGHIVSIIGVDESNVKKFGRAPSLLLINSAAKGDSNQCLPQREPYKNYFGKTGWTDDYTLKYYGIYWIEENK